MKKKNGNLRIKRAVLGFGAVIAGVFLLHASATVWESNTKISSVARAEEVSVMDYLVEKWKNRESPIDLAGYRITPSELTALKFRAKKLHPELYYLASNEYYQDADGYITQLNTIYAVSRDAELEAEAAKVEALIDDTMSDLEKALVVHDYLCLDIVYLDSNTTNHDIRGAILDKEAVCEGYAEAYKYYLDRIGVPCNVVSGPANVGGYTITHAWNQVKIDGKWYFVDATWDDMDTGVKHEYFLCSETNFPDHSWNKEVYETCDDTRFDKAFWNNFGGSSGMKSGFYAHDGSLCYIADGGIFRHDLETDRIEKEGSLMLPITDVWHIYSGAAAKGYSKIASYGGLLYYSTPKAVYSCKFDGSEKKAVVELREDSEQEIYDMEILGGTLYYDTAAGLYTTRTRHSYTVDSDYQKAEYPISIQASSVSVSYGEEHRLNSYAPGTITYTSDRPEICTVDSSGVISTVSCGTANITLQTEGTDLYLPGHIVIPVTVVPKDISSGYLTLSDYQVTYNGKPQTPAVTLNRVAGITEEEYTVTYQNNVKPGTATVVVTAHGDKYTGTLTANFQIVQGSGTVIDPEPETKETETETETKETETETETKETETETETKETEIETETKETETETETKEIETETEPKETETEPKETETEPESKETETQIKAPQIELETQSPVVVPDTESKTEIPGGSGTEPQSPASVKKPVKVRLSSAKASGKKKIKICWKSQTCNGYRIEIAKKRNFKRLIKAINVRGKKKKAKVVSGLKSKTTYYVRVRAYKKVNGKIYYGAYSKIKRVRTK